jgi:hypothetical protein
MNLSIVYMGNILFHVRVLFFDERFFLNRYVLYESGME